MKYLKQFSIIIAITLVAEILKSLIDIPIPSSIYGMVILFVLLCLKVIKPEQIQNASDFLIGIMSVMFVPSAVGIINNFQSITSMLPALIISITVLTALVMVVTGKVTDFLVKKVDK